MNYYVNRDKAKLYNYLQMMAILIKSDETPEHDPPHKNVERIKQLRETYASYREDLRDYFLGERMLFIGIMNHFTSEVTTPQDYLNALNYYIKHLDKPAFFSKLCYSLDLKCKHHDLGGVQNMLAHSNLSDQEKWQVLQVFSQPKTYLFQLLKLATELFRKFDQASDWEIQFNEELSQISDEKLIADYQMVEQTFTQDTKRFSEHEIVPVGFEPHSAGLFIQGKRLSVSLGIHFADYLQANSQLDTKQKSEFFKNLSDPTRYDMLKLLANSDYSNKYLAETLGVTAPNISYHLRTLLKEGLLKLDLDSDRPTYRINRDYFHQMITALEADMGLSDEVNR